MLRIYHTYNVLFSEVMCSSLENRFIQHALLADIHKGLLEWLQVDSQAGVQPWEAPHPSSVLGMYTLPTSLTVGAVPST